ncbi:MULTISPECIES: hypothetical protein [Burkholderia cepacia complex]|uniref:hypothetical protein n=1 Tax=Burkholderia cepacia complex TaxID=87882 RepID=UPI0010436B9F|nr:MULTISPECIES: hypothetical protein [Burkholderia cepacia complex]TDA45958.1 hypothetical protein EVG18_18945 [Burkholderia pyrrocinia]HDR9511084.1 hypothetical protein [Burkholderia cepacia]
MSNRHSVPPVDGVVSPWPTTLGHTMVIGTTASGKTTLAAFYDVFRLTESEFRRVKGRPGSGAAGDEACA